MITNNQWERYIYALHLEGAKNGKKVTRLDYELLASDIIGSFNITDLQIQEGEKASGTIPHVSDFLDPLYFNINESYYIDDVVSDTTGEPNGVKLGAAQPDTSDNRIELANRIFNVVSRGHDVIVVPNVFHEDYTKEIVTSALDLTLYAKDDFDLLRISTNVGAPIPDRFYSDIPSLSTHPLNTMYTREFFFGGGLAGDKIELKTSIRSAKINDQNFPLYFHSLESGGKTYSIKRQRLMIAPAGSFRVRVEFYKNVTETLKDVNGNDIQYTYLKDTGIGYNGLAELNQWTYGRSKL